MTNTSATGGPLLPAATPAPLQDDALADFFQSLIVGLTGLGATMVRPRWQPIPPNRPDIATDWAALGIVDLVGDTYAYQQHIPSATAGAGANLLLRQEDLEILCSFYGPNSGKNAALLRDGLSLSQNREALGSGVGLTEVGKIIQAPDLYNEKWYKRYDLRMKFKREILRIYPILNLLSADGNLYAEGSSLIIRPLTVTN